MQERPVCFKCDREIKTNAEMVFEAPCGHDHHSSAVFHGVCLMDWREHRATFMERLRQHIEQTFGMPVIFEEPDA
jgi:hypothetical protein